MCLLRVNFVDIWICCVLGLPIFPILLWPLEENLTVVLGLLLSRSSCSWVSHQAGDGNHGWLWSTQQVKLCWTSAILLTLWNINRGAQWPGSFHEAQHYLFQEQKVSEEQVWQAFGRYITAAISILCSNLARLHLAALCSSENDLSGWVTFCLSQFCIRWTTLARQNLDMLFYRPAKCDMNTVSFCIWFTPLQVDAVNI